MKLISFLAYVRAMATQERKHTKVRIVDHVAVITLDSPNAKVVCLDWSNQNEK